jgi:hypothetical protein
VLVKGARPVPVLWAELHGLDPSAARETLRVCEGCNDVGVASWPGDARRLGYDSIEAWALSQGLDHVVWTALGPLFEGKRGVGPSCAQAAINYLRSRPADLLARAEEYGRRAQRQVATDFRAAFERELGWTPLDA